MCEPSYVLKFEEGTPVSDKASIWRVIRGFLGVFFFLCHNLNKFLKVVL